MALKSQEYDGHERDKLDSELSAHAHCNGLVMSQSNVDSASIGETAHDWEDYKTMDKDFYDDGTITFFWYLCDTFIYTFKRQYLQFECIKDILITLFVLLMGFVASHLNDSSCKNIIDFIKKLFSGIDAV